MNSRMLVAVAATRAKKRKDKQKIERRMKKGRWAMRKTRKMRLSMENYPQRSMEIEEKRPASPGDGDRI